MSFTRTLASALVACALAAAPASALAVTFTVNTTNYTAPATPSNTGGIKAAVQYANTHAGTTIAFNIPTSDPGYVAAGGYFRIAPPSSEFNVPLAISQSGTVLDGSTQTAIANSNPNGPEIYLDGTAVIHPNDPMGNYGSDGVVLQAVNNVVVRGLAIGNYNNGILVTGGGYNTIDGNNIGVNATSNGVVGNLHAGVYLYNTVDNLVGAYNTTQPNLIGGNQHGVQIYNGSYFNIVQVNAIGTNLAGTLDLGNLGNGVRIDSAAHDNNVGGNTIAFNHATGVLIYLNAGTVNGVRNNAIYNNRCMAVRIQPTVTPCANLGNDYQDYDTGPNSRQNRPTITSAVYSGGTLTINATLNSLPNSSFIVDFFATPNLNPEGHAEGRTPLGYIPVTTDSMGNATFSYQVSYNASTQYITASASHWVGAGQYETSEYADGYHLP